MRKLEQAGGECLERLVLYPLVMYEQEFSEGEEIPDLARHGRISHLALWELVDAQRKRYRHVPDLGGKEYVIEMTKGTGRVTIEYIDGERTINDYAAVYEVRGVGPASRERVELFVKKIENEWEKEKVCAGFMKQYFGKLLYYSGVPFEVLGISSKARNI